MGEKDKKTDYTIIFIFLILLLIFLVGVIIFYYYKNNFLDARVYFECLPGQCATNRFNGEKKCALDPAERVVYNIGYEVCNSKYGCENLATPYALLPDGSTNIMGTCEKGQVCRCLSENTCASEIVSIFSLNGESINNIGSRSSLDQVSLNIQGGGGSQQFIITDTKTQFCSIKPFHLNRISPGACVFENPEDISLFDLQKCFRKNPCIVGLLAFNPHNSETFVLNKENKSEIYNSIVSCVSSQKNLNSQDLANYCDFGEVPVYNKKTNLVECYVTGFD